MHLKNILVKTSVTSMAALAFGAIPVSQANAEIVLKLNSYIFPKHFFVSKVSKGWGDRVSKATQGRVKMMIPVKSLTPGPRAWSSVETGIAGVAISHDGFQRKRLQLMQVGYMPLTTVSAEKSGVALTRTYNKFFKPANEYKGVKFLGLWQHSGSFVFNSKHAINKVSDFKGLKLRATAGVGVEAMKLLGVKPVATTGAEIFEKVSKRIVDGLLFPVDGIPRFKIAKYVKHATFVPGSFYNQSWSLIMSKKIWDGLSKADQKAIDAVSGEQVAIDGGRAFDTKGKAAKAKLKKAGMQMVEADAAFVADLKKTFAPLEANFLKLAQKKGVDGKAALAYFHSQLK
jgi:TRAP-type C4-dicarboxylate transport system substrate-binding protein